MVVLHLTDNSVLRTFNESDDVVYLFARRYLILNLKDGIFKGEIAHINKAVGVSDVA